MRHRAHLYLQGPWGQPTIEASTAQNAHLERVFRIESGAEITYTDGTGTFGIGTYRGGMVTRGAETTSKRTSEMDVAVAPPKSRERQRFIVEKLQELGVARIIWLQTAHGEGRPPKPEKAEMWAVSALEQSRGVWKSVLVGEIAGWEQLRPPVVICRVGGDPRPPVSVGTLAIGPEGGWSDQELPEGIAAWSLGPTVLRVETAAIVATARAMGDNGNG